MSLECYGVMHILIILYFFAISYLIITVRHRPALHPLEVSPGSSLCRLKVAEQCNFLLLMRMPVHSRDPARLQFSTGSPPLQPGHLCH